MKKLFLTLLISFLLFCLNGFSQTDTLKNGEELISSMHKKYADVWYKHISFKQDMYWYKDDSLLRNEVWVAAYSAPGNLHIRYKDFDSGRGWLIVNDTLYSFNHNKLIGKKLRLHEVMTLGFDIYVIQPEVIIKKLKRMNFDLSVFEIKTVNGIEVYQIGDYSNRCFWIQRDNLLFYGFRKNEEMGESEVFFENYKNFYGNPVATQIQYFRNNQLYLIEKYFEIRLPTEMPNSFFDPNLFSNTRW